MTQPTEQREPAPATETAPQDTAEPAASTLAPLFERWNASLRNVAHRWLAIAALEARVAALNITLMLVVAVASGLLLATAWIALFAAIVAGLHALGLAWHFALLLVAVVNLTLAIAGFHHINRMSNHLIFNTLRALVAEPEQSDADNRAGPAAGDAPAAKTD
jgi:hypothetical protein